MILAAERLGGQNDLMLGIDQGLGVVALDHPVGGGHLHRLVIDDIALDLFAIAAALGFLLLQKLVQPFHLQLEAPFLFLLAFQFHLRVVCLPGHVRRSPAVVFSAAYRVCV